MRLQTHNWQNTLRYSRDYLIPLSKSEQLWLAQRVGTSCRGGAPACQLMHPLCFVWHKKKRRKFVFEATTWNFVACETTAVGRRSVWCQQPAQMLIYASFTFEEERYCAHLIFIFIFSHIPTFTYCNDCCSFAYWSLVSSTPGFGLLFFALCAEVTQSLPNLGSLQFIYRSICPF